MVGTAPKVKSTLPDRKSASAGAPPRYGTITIAILVICRNCSPARWMPVPMPADAKVMGNPEIPFRDFARFLGLRTTVAADDAEL